MLLNWCDAFRVFFFQIVIERFMICKEPSVKYFLFLFFDGSYNFETKFKFKF